MNKAYLKRLIFRLFALVMAFGVVYSVQNPALAVAPQQGWFISGTTTFSGKDSWVISYGGSSVVGSRVVRKKGGAAASAFFRHWQRST